MSVKMNLWSLTLLPGEKYPLYVRRDFTITNAALGEELRSTDGRSVVKVTHHPLPADFFDSDSEDESIDDDDDASEDEFELDEEEGFKRTPKKGEGKVNGDVKMAGDGEEDEDENEDEDDGDDEDDEDFSDDEVEETTVLCSLTAGKTEQTTLNLTFCEGDAVMFEATGENAVHLMGNYIIQPRPNGEDYDSEEFDDEHDDYSELYGSDEDEELDDEPVGRITEIVETTKPAKKAISAAAPDAAKPKATVPASTKPDATAESKKRKADAIESPAPKAAAPAAAASSAAEGLSKSQKKKLAKKAKTEGGAAAPATGAEKKPEGGKQKVRV